MQLHSVKEALKEDFEGTLEALAAMGFKGVEFAGHYGKYKRDPVGLKNFLDSLGLTASGAHIGLAQLQGDNALNQFTFFKALGVKLILIPHDKRIDNAEKIDELIADITKLSILANSLDMKLGYHNHAKEFKPYKNSTFWDYLALNTPPEFVLQLDAGWANFAAIDPITYVKRYPNRTLTTHFKVRTYQGKPGPVSKDKKVIIGQNNYDWAALIKATIQYGNTQWIVVEQEEYPNGLTPLQAVQQSLNGLNTIISNIKMAH
ncbi:sugar phosphate isomerase/epimerase family protein [Algibacillus agarilyticus]|uniref:sugar phosphate isomerase/epimerase family protein n=1 Tax=Algibacillus agarilyticus TaxID=2234133 RepID=UPI001E65BBC5|nr:sugar phosphate isomerase/epimerase [Algibacillus agarilyticus]